MHLRVMLTLFVKIFVYVSEENSGLDGKGK